MAPRAALGYHNEITRVREYDLYSCHLYPVQVFVDSKKWHFPEYMHGRSGVFNVVSEKIGLTSRISKYLKSKGQWGFLYIRRQAQHNL